MKVFAIFGILCVSSLDSMDKRCMNFWEEPIVKYETVQECGIAAKQKGKEIELNFTQNNLEIESLEVYCLPIDKYKKT